MRKGQAEILIILGIIVVGVIAILLATQSFDRPISTPPSDLRGSLEHLIRSGADETQRVLSLNGGYAAPAGGAVFLEQSVPYWQENGVLNIPAVEQNFEEFLTAFINENKDSFVEGLGGEIVVGRADVDATFLNDKIILNVNLPSSRNNVATPPNYQIEILSRFGEVLDFSRTFTQMQTDNRYLEVFTLNSIIASPIENGEFVTPWFIQLATCGDFIFRSYQDIQPAMRDRVATTLAHTYLPGKSPVNVGDVTPFPKYLLPLTKPYTDLDVSFHLADDGLNPTNFQFTPDPIQASADPIGFTGICVSDPLYVRYFLSLPVIVRVKDTITGHIFQFALPLFIDNNAPGTWGIATDGDRAIQAQICEDLFCSVSLAVTGTSGEPVSGADVSFMGCSIGRTSSQGVLETAGPCGAGPLQVYAKGYDFYIEQTSYTNMEDKTVTLSQLVSPALFIHEAIVADNIFSNQYWIMGTVPLDGKLLLSLRSTETDKIYTRVFDEPGEALKGVPVGTYMVIGTLMNEDLTVLRGSLSTFLTLTEGVEELYFYVPQNTEFVGMEDQNAIFARSRTLTTVLERCGVGPVQSTAFDGEFPCIKEYSEV